MLPQLDAHADGTSKQTWDRLLADATPCDHIVQFYQDPDFLNRAVCRFAGAALTNGEGIILVPTLTHWNAIRPRLEAEGVDVQAAQKRGRLTVVDADEFLPASCETPCRIRLYSSASPQTSSETRALEGATKKSIGGEKW